MSTPDSTPPQIVFACVRNGGRSVISRVLAEHYAQGRVIALSAGTKPGEHIHREVADVLEQLGLDTSQEKPTLLTRETIAASTMGMTSSLGVTRTTPPPSAISRRAPSLASWKSDGRRRRTGCPMERTRRCGVALTSRGRSRSEPHRAAAHVLGRRHGRGRRRRPG